MTTLEPSAIYSGQLGSWENKLCNQTSYGNWLDPETKLNLTKLRCSKRFYTCLEDSNLFSFYIYRFIYENERKVDINQACYYPTFASNRWLSVRLESIGNLIILVRNACHVTSRQNKDITNITKAHVTNNFLYNIAKKDIFGPWIYIGQGKLLRKHNTRYIKFLWVYLGWALKPMSQNHQISQYCLQKCLVWHGPKGSYLLCIWFLKSLSWFGLVNQSTLFAPEYRKRMFYMATQLY